MSSTAVAKPSMFGAMNGLGTTTPNTGLDTVDTSVATTPYVGFVSKKSSNYGEVISALPGIADDTPYLRTPTGYEKLNALRFHTLAAAQFYVQRDDANKAVAATKKEPSDGFKSPLKENIEIVGLVYRDNGTVIPASISLAKGRSPAGRVAVKATQDAASAEWGTKSAEHKESLGISDPRFRAVTTVTSSYGIAKGSGFRFGKASAVYKPTTLGDARMIEASVKTDEFQKALRSVQSAFNARISELEILAAK